MARATPVPPVPGLPPRTAGVLFCDCGPSARQLSGIRWPSPDEVAQWIRRALARLEQPPDWITFAGTSEPTQHPRFAVMIDRVLAARNALAPSVRIAVLSSGRWDGVPSIRDALRRVDAGSFGGWCQFLAGAGLDRLRIYSLATVPRERLEEMARMLRDALSGVVVEVS